MLNVYCVLLAEKSLRTEKLRKGDFNSKTEERVHTFDIIEILNKIYKLYIN